MARVLTQLQLHRVPRTLLLTPGGRGQTWGVLTRTHRLFSPHSLHSETRRPLSSGLITVPVAGQDHQFHPLWLRQNCRCPACYNQDTNQNNLLPHTLKEVRAVETQVGGDQLTVNWTDGHRSHYRLSWLLENSYPGRPPKAEQFLWNSKTLAAEDIPRVTYDKFLSEDAGLRDLLGSLLKYGIGLVTDVAPSVEGTQQCVERVCFVQETLFGKMWSFTSDMARGDTAYTSISLGAHNDTTYLTIPAGIQVFHCLQHDGQGGETLLVDGFQVAESLRKTDPGAFDLLSTTKVHHEYVEPGYHVRSLDTILRVHPVTAHLQWIRYNHYDRAPITTVPQRHLEAFYHALHALSEGMERPNSELWVKLRPGMVLFVDNWRVLHGRAAFTGRRTMAGCYLPRDDWRSRARVLGLL